MRRPLVLFALSAVAFGALTTPAHGDEPSAVGWWTSTPGAQPAEEGGFEVAGLAGNPVSVAALRFATAPAGATATLTLQESGGTVTATTALQVCPTTDSWQPANPGPLEDAPEPDCTAGVALTRDEEAATWTASVGGILGAGTLMVVPGDEPGGDSPVDVGFRVTFSGADLVVVGGPSASPTPTPAPLPSGSGGGSSGSNGGSSSPSFTPAPSPSFSGPGPATPTTVASGGGTTVTTVAVDEGATGDTGGEAFAAPDLAPGATVGGGGTDQPWERLLFLVPLSALAGVLWIYAKRYLAQRGLLEDAA